MTDDLMLYRHEPPMFRDDCDEPLSSCAKCRKRWRCDGWDEDHGPCDEGEVE